MSRSFSKHLAYLSALLVGIFIVMIVTAATPSAALTPDNVTVTATADTFVSAREPNTNFGAAHYLDVRSVNSYSLVSFDEGELKSAIGSKELISATLSIHVNKAGHWGRKGGELVIHRLAASWVEGNGYRADGSHFIKNRGTGSGATWACAIDSNIANRSRDCSGSTIWDLGGSDGSHRHPWAAEATARTTVGDGQQDLAFDVTADVLTFVSGKSENRGWIVKAKNAGRGRARLSSRETEAGPQLILVLRSGDTDAPQVEPQGLTNAEQDGDYTNGVDAYSVDVAATDADTGVARIAVREVGGVQLATSSADCSASCPAEYSPTLSVDTSALAEGAHRLVATAYDGAGNEGDSKFWTLWVDRTSPSPVSDIRVARFDESTGTTTIGWNQGDDPQLADGALGSGVQSYQYRYRIGSGAWSDYEWSDVPEFDLQDGTLGDIVDVEVSEADSVGNAGPSTTATLTVFAASEPVPWYSAPASDDPASDVTLTDEQQDIALNAIDGDPRLQSLLGTLDWSPTGITAWSTNGTEATVVGADITIIWSTPVTLDATWYEIDFPNGPDSYTVDQVSYPSINTTSLEIYVTFDPTAVVAFSPVDSVVDEDSVKTVGSSGVISLSPPVTPMKSVPLRSNAAQTNSLPNDLIHALNPLRISNSNSWFTGSDYFWNYDFDSTQFDLTKKPVAQHHGDWPVTVIFTNDASTDIAKFVWSHQVLATPMNMRLYDGYPRLVGNPTTPVWVRDSGAWTGSVCWGTKWHYRVYAPHGSPYGSYSMYNLKLGYYVLATTHKDHNEQTNWAMVCGKPWWGDSESVEERLVRDAVNYNTGDPNDVRFYANEDQFKLGNRDMRETVGRRHYNNNGKASQICVSLVSPLVRSCATQYPPVQ